jgi:NTP pyrophosphatase (non-canonical NTP hydrolase)
MTYYLYHIPGKKIGVTRDLNKRVTQVQGYKPGEYEVLESSTGLKEALENEPNLIWKTGFGKIALCPELTKWIVTNAIESRYNSSRSYVYNKALWEAFTKINSLESLIKHADKFKPGTTEKVNHQLTDLGINHFDLIRAWAAERGLYEKGNANTQYVKLQEEAGELAKALLDRDKPEIKDAIGDIVVVLTNLAYLEGFTIEECIEAAYEEISNRKGKMINGTFVKDIEVHEEKVL